VTFSGPADPYAAGDLVQTAPGLTVGLPSAFSSNPVRYADGVVELSFPDLTSQVGTLPVGYTRSWSNGSGYSTGLKGSGMVVTQLPHLVQDTGGTLDLISNGYTVRYFAPDGLGGRVQRPAGPRLLLLLPVLLPLLRPSLSPPRAVACPAWSLRGEVPRRGRGRDGP
jgi:hypothetical protein